MVDALKTVLKKKVITRKVVLYKCLSVIFP